jgi:hypothetical protein
VDFALIMSIGSSKGTNSTQKYSKYVKYKNIGYRKRFYVG